MKFAAVRLLKHAPVEHTQSGTCASCCCWRCASRRCCCWRSRSRGRSSPPARRCATSGVTVVALDTSLQHVGARTVRARQAAREGRDRRAPAGDLVGVVTFADEARDRRAGRRPIACWRRRRSTRRRPGSAATRYRAALSAASQALDGRSGTIVVVTDLQENGWDAGDRASVPDGDDDRGRRRRRDAAEPCGDRDPARSTIASSPRFTTPAPRARDAQRAPRRSTIARRRRVTVPLGAESDRRGDVCRRAARHLGDRRRGRCGRDCRRTTCATRCSAARAGRRCWSSRRPAISSRDAFYVQHALAAGAPGDAAFQVQGVGGAQLSTWSEDRLAAHAAVVLLSTRGLERRGRELLAAYARSGGGMLIAAGPDVDGSIVGDVLGAGSTLRIVTANGSTRPGPRALAPADVRHPVFQRLRRERRDARPRDVPERGADRRQRLPDAGAVHHRRNGAGRVPVRRRARAGARVRSRQPVERFPAARDLRAVPARGGALPGERARACVRIFRRRRAGRRAAACRDLALDRRPRACRAQIAVNVDPREADPARISVEDFQSAVTRLKGAAGSEARVEARQQEDRQHLWQYALALMAAAAGRSRGCRGARGRA